MKNSENTSFQIVQLGAWQDDKGPYNPVQTHCCRATQLARAVYVCYVPSAKQVLLNKRQIREAPRRIRPSEREGSLDSGVDERSSPPRPRGSAEPGPPAQRPLCFRPLRRLVSRVPWSHTRRARRQEDAARLPVFGSGALGPRAAPFGAPPPPLPPNQFHKLSNSARRVANPSAHAESDLKWNGP